MIPNAIIELDITPHQLGLWVKLMRLTVNGASKHIDKGMKGIAAEVGAPYVSFTKSIKSLESIGLVRRQGEYLDLLLPTAKELEKAKEEEQKTLIVQELDEQPKRESSGVTQKTAWEQICEAWNRSKPDAWAILDGKFNLPVFIAIETQAKRLHLSRPDYPMFVERVAKGGNADDWWKERNLKASNVFGFSGKIEDKKFQNVEKLYKLGKNAPEKFSWNDTESVLRWYRTKKPELEFNCMETILVDELEEAWEHDAAQELGGTVYLYRNRAKGHVEHWSGKRTRTFRYTPD